jgi:hypothetical protein
MPSVFPPDDRAENVKLSKVRSLVLALLNESADAKSQEANGWTIGGQEVQGCYGWNTNQSNGASDVAWWGCNQWDATARLWNIRCAEGKYIGWQPAGTTATGYMCSFFHGDSADANCLGGEPANTNAQLKQIKGTCKVNNPAVDQVSAYCSFTRPD